MAMMQFIVCKVIDQKEIQKISETFKAIDIDNNGKISLSELK